MDPIEKYNNIREAHMLDTGSVDEVVESLEGLVETFGSGLGEVFVSLKCPFHAFGCEYGLLDDVSDEQDLPDGEDGMREIVLISTASHMLTEHHKMDG